MATIQKQRQARAHRALSRARSGGSLYNDMDAERQARDAGYPDAQARVNLLTFKAWQALGRNVRKGEKSCAKVVTWIPAGKVVGRDPETGDPIREGKRPWTAYLFHVSQTEETAR